MQLRLLSRFVPIIMLTVFFGQITLVEFGNLDRWKGMGMGMFSSIRERGIERLEVQKNGEWRDARTEALAEAPLALIQFSQFPNRWTEARVLRDLKTQDDVVPSDIRSRVSGVGHFSPHTGVVTKTSVYDSIGE